MELTVENFQEARQICIKAVLEAMKTLAPQAYIGGEGSEDGIYVAGVNEQNRILNITSNRNRKSKGVDYRGK